MLTLVPITRTHTRTRAQTIHGSMMVFAFGLCLVFGVFIARYVQSCHWWFWVHLLSQSIGFLAAVTAFVIALIMVEGRHFRYVHTWFGLTTMILLCFQPVLGFLADRYYDSQRTVTPMFPDRIHWIIGWLSLLFGFISILLGMELFDVASGIIIVFCISAVFWFAVMVLLFLTSSYQSFKSLSA